MMLAARMWIWWYIYNGSIAVNSKCIHLLLCHCCVWCVFICMGVLIHSWIYMMSKDVGSFSGRTLAQDYQLAEYSIKIHFVSNLKAVCARVYWQLIWEDNSNSLNACFVDWVFLQCLRLFTSAWLSAYLSRFWVINQAKNTGENDECSLISQSHIPSVKISAIFLFFKHQHVCPLLFP